MRVLVQRVSEAAVHVDGVEVGRIGPGLLAFVGVTHGDVPDDADWLARKVHGLRLLRGERSLADLTHVRDVAMLLAVSQFTLYGDARRGRRPTWAAAAPRPMAEPLVDRFVDTLRELGVEVATGVFGADMAVGLVNDGPVTLLLEHPAVAGPV